MRKRAAKTTAAQALEGVESGGCGGVKGSSEGDSGSLIILMAGELDEGRINAGTFNLNFNFVLEEIRRKCGSAKMPH
jgi:hypothetical protein